MAGLRRVPDENRARDPGGRARAELVVLPDEGLLEAAAAAGAFEPDLSLWDAWRPEQVAAQLAGVRAPWYVAAGWAIELFLGEQRREHEDIEIAVPRKQFPEIAEALAGFELFIPDGDLTDPGLVWPFEQAPKALDGHQQTWVREPATGRWLLDVFREPSDGDTWICRRDERIRLPYREVIERTDDGIPYGRPEIVLLFKAKHSDRPKDEADFAAVLPRLEPDRRTWLAESLALLHPGHSWLQRI